MSETNKWVVTGAAGFLGSHVVEQLLKKNQEVLGIDDLSWGIAAHVEPLTKSPRGHFEKIDIRDVKALSACFQAYRPTHVVHLAALHFIPDAIKNPSLAVDINVKGTQSVLQSLRETAYQRLFFASTGDVYINTEADNREDTTPAEPYNIYGLTKLFGEKLMELEHKYYTERKIIVGRIYNLIGPRETNPHIIPEIIKQLKQNPRCLSLGNISPIRDYVPVNECARAIIELCEKSTAGLSRYNIATGQGQSVGDLISSIESLLGHVIEVHKDPAKVRAVERERLVASVERLKGFLGWTPTSQVAPILRDLLIFEKLLKG